MQDTFVIQDQEEKLAHSLIEEYLRSAGYSFDTIGQLPPEQLKELMVKASVHASIKLAEIDERARVVTSLHHTSEGFQ